MKKLYNKVKYRWKVAPTWVKVVDISCWIILLSLIVICSLKG